MTSITRVIEEGGAALEIEWASAAGGAARRRSVPGATKRWAGSTVAGAAGSLER